MAKHIYKPGIKITCKSPLEYDGCRIPPGTYEIVALSSSQSDGLGHIGVTSKKALKSWGDLNGQTASGHGLWLSIEVVDKYFKLDHVGRKMVIKNKFMFKRKDLRGKTCKIVGNLPNSKITFVELQEHIDGCSADGLGKAGHCILISQEHLKKVE